jgi:hypothetical protein
MSKSKTKIMRTTTWSAGPGCHGGCGVLAHVKDGKLIKIEGDPTHPWNQAVCESAGIGWGRTPDVPDVFTPPVAGVYFEVAWNREG